MTIKYSKNSGTMIAQCDKCFDVVDFEDLDDPGYNHFSEAKQRIDADGWKTKRIGDKWVNICPDCI